MCCNQIIKHDATDSYLLTVPSVNQLRVLLGSMCDSGEFLSDFGIRSLSKVSDQFYYVIDDSVLVYNPDIYNKIYYCTLILGTFVYYRATVLLIV